MNDTKLLAITKQLVAIESTEHNLPGLAQAIEVIVQMVKARRPDVTIERFESNGKPSILAYKAARRPKRFHVIFNGHLDVVAGKPGQFKMTEKDGNLYGRGVYDMKAAAVVMTDVFCEYVDKLPYSLALQFGTDEELNSKDGTLYQIQRGVRADFVISGECGRPIGSYEIANEAKGLVIARVAFSGTAAHSAYPWKGDNAILKAMRFIDLLHQRYPVATEESGETLVNVTSMTTDTDAHNLLPDRATVMLSARYVAGDPDFTSKRHFVAMIEHLDPEAEIVEIIDFTAPIYTDPKNPLLMALKRAAESVEGKPFKFVRRHGTGDGRFYGEVGNEACEFGTVGEGQHSDTEHITLEGFRNYHETLRRFLDQTITDAHKAEKVAQAVDG